LAASLLRPFPARSLTSTPTGVSPACEHDERGLSRPERPSVRLPPDLATDPEVGRRGARVVGDLAGAGSDAAAGDELGLRLHPALTDRDLRRADAAAGAVGEEALDPAVLERVEGDRGEAAAGR